MNFLKYLVSLIVFSWTVNIINYNNPDGILGGVLILTSIYLLKTTNPIVVNKKDDASDDISERNAKEDN